MMDCFLTNDNLMINECWFDKMIDFSTNLITIFMADQIIDKLIDTVIDWDTQ